MPKGVGGRELVYRLQKLDVRCLNSIQGETPVGRVFERTLVNVLGDLQQVFEDLDITRSKRVGCEESARVFE